MDKIKNKFGTIIKEKTSLSFRKYAIESGLCEMLMVFMHVSSEFISTQDKRHLIKQFIKEAETNSSNINDKLKSIFETAGEQFLEVSTYESYFCFLAYTRTIDNFISYLKDILIEVMNKKPDLLKSSETEKLDFILSFNNIEDLRKALIDKKIEKLLYKGIDDLLDYIKDRLGIELIDSDDEKKFINQMIKQRNLIVHNRGIISKSFAKEFAQYSDKVGATLIFNYLQISKINVILNNGLIEFDETVSKKFNLDLVNIHE